MPKPRRPENKGLPARWRFTRNAYYYQVPPGLEHLWDGKKTFRLGTTLPEAYKKWAERIETSDKATYIGQLLDRYLLEVVPAKAPKTQAGNLRQIERLRTVFGSMFLQEIEPRHVYGYIANRKAKVAARREIAVFSHAYTKAVEWGYLNRHPFKGEVRLKSEQPRTRYVTDAEIIECLSLGSLRKRGSVKAIQAYIRVKLLTGMRRGDLLRLRMVDLQEDGIHVNTSKTGKALIYEWSAQLREAVVQAKDARPVHISPYLFCTKRGESYLDETTGEAHGWASMWQRFMDRVLKETQVQERFTEHDLRAKAASDAENIEHARALLAHADSKITQRIYRRKPEKVKPAR